MKLFLLNLDKSQKQAGINSLITSRGQTFGPPCAKMPPGFEDEKQGMSLEKHPERRRNEIKKLSFSHACFFGVISKCLKKSLKKFQQVQNKLF